MGIVKKKMLELSDHLEGTDGRVAQGGGYLYIYLAGKLIHIAGIPSPYLLAERQIRRLIILMILWITTVMNLKSSSTHPLQVLNGLCKPTQMTSPSSKI